MNSFDTFKGKFIYHKTRGRKTEHRYEQLRKNKIIP